MGLGLGPSRQAGRLQRLLELLLRDLAGADHDGVDLEDARGGRLALLGVALEADVQPIVVHLVIASTAIVRMAAVRRAMVSIAMASMATLS